MKLITADFETYYDKQYSLSKITTEEYIRSPLFEVIGVSVAVDDQPPVWFSGTMEATGQWLSQFDWADGMLLAHNAMFDAAILSWRFGIRPKALADTLSMGRALHGTEVGGSLKVLAEHYCIGVKGTEVENALGKHRADFTPPELARYGEYCRNDVELTRSLFYAMLSGGFEHKELKLIDLTLRMFTEPKLALNTITLIDHLRDTQNKKEALLEKVSAEKSTLMSNPQFAQYLTLLGVTPPTKISPTTGKETWAFSKTDEGFKALLEHPNEEVQALAAARIGVKSTLEETRTQRFIDIASRGLMPVPLRYYAAHTGRWGGCLVADTEVIVYNSQNEVESKRIVDVLLDDLVWDGEAFVEHEGVVFSGYSEVIEWDGVKGTKDHVVFTDAGEISLSEAMQGSHRIKIAESFTNDHVGAARKLAESVKRKATL